MLERYTDEEKKRLEQLNSEHKDKTAEEVAEIAVASKQFGSRTVDAIRQRIFKLRREQKSKRAVKSKAVAKATAPKKAPRATGAKRRGRKPRARVEEVQEVSGTSPIPAAATEEGNGFEVELELPQGVKVRGSSNGIANFFKQLPAA